MYFDIFKIILANFVKLRENFMKISQNFVIFAKIKLKFENIIIKHIRILIFCRYVGILALGEIKMKVEIF